MQRDSTRCLGNQGMEKISREKSVREKVEDRATSILPISKMRGRYSTSKRARQRLLLLLLSRVSRV